MNRNNLVILILATLLVACGQADRPSVGAATGDSGYLQYVILTEDLQRLKDDFNANEGRVRLMFLSGPTCGICLRGMADLNDEFLADSQTDDRLVTLVVHVPTLGATEEHVADTIPLLSGPRIHHYWEESGILGQHYREVMDVESYVWDFWAIYSPEARWDELLPPRPDYFEHQIGAFPRELYLDASRFAAQALSYVEQVDLSLFSKGEDIDLKGEESQADGTLIPVIAQPRNVAVRQHIIGRGGFSNLKRIQSIEARGQILADGNSRSLTIRSERPNVLRRVVGFGEEMSVAERTSEGEVTIDSGTDRGLPADFEQILLSSWEFDGMFVEWPKKGHEVSMVGMMKIDDVLAWKLELQQKDGEHWNMFVDSHTGGLVQASLLDSTGEPAYIIRQSNFRDTSGFMFPHRIEYMDGAGQTLAVETIDEIELEVTPFEIEQEAVSH
jgi:hypothetical protein